MQFALRVLLVFFALSATAHAACGNYKDPETFSFPNRANTSALIRGEVTRVFLSLDRITLRFDAANFDRGIWGKMDADCVRVIYYKNKVDPAFYNLLGSQLAGIKGREVMLEYSLTDRGTGETLPWFEF